MNVDGGYTPAGHTQRCSASQAAWPAGSASVLGLGPAPGPPHRLPRLCMRHLFMQSLTWQCAVAAAQWPPRRTEACAASSAPAWHSLMGRGCEAGHVAMLEALAAASSALRETLLHLLCL